jgi:hypothetical protein
MRILIALDGSDASGAGLAATALAALGPFALVAAAPPHVHLAAVLPPPTLTVPHPSPVATAAAVAEVLAAQQQQARADELRAEEALEAGARACAKAGVRGSGAGGGAGWSAARGLRSPSSRPATRDRAGLACSRPQAGSGRSCCRWRCAGLPAHPGTQTTRFVPASPPGARGGHIPPRAPGIRGRIRCAPLAAMEGGDAEAAGMATSCTHTLHPSCQPHAFWVPRPPAPFLSPTHPKHPTPPTAPTQAWPNP